MTDETFDSTGSARPATFRGISELDVAAIRRRLDDALAIWYVCRTLDDRGCGSVDVSALDFLPPRTKSRVLAKGRGVLWTASGNRLYLRKLPALAKALGVEYVRTFYVAPLAWITRRRFRRARFALNAFASMRRGKPISVLSMAVSLGVSTRTVRRWLRGLRWGRKENLLLVQSINQPDLANLLRMKRLAKKWADPRLRMVQQGGRVDFFWQSPNTLRERSQREGRGALRRRVNRVLSCDTRGRGQRPRLGPASSRLPVEAGVPLQNPSSPSPYPSPEERMTFLAGPSFTPSHQPPASEGVRQSARRSLQIEAERDVACRVFSVA